MRRLLGPTLAVLAAACASSTGGDAPDNPYRRDVSLRFPAEDGALLSVLDTAVRSKWSDQSPTTRRRFTEEAWERARATLGGRADQITYASAGARVGALLVRPEVVGGRRYPVILVCRDGVGDEGLDPDALLVELARWADEGYVAIATAYQGSRLSQGDDAPGSPQDVLALLRLLPHVDYADAQRVFLVGRGHGAQRALAALRGSDGVRAAALVGGELDGRIDISGLTEPLLVAHGSADRRVPLHLAQRLTEALAGAGTEQRLLTLVGGDHTLGAESAQIDEEIAEWFAAHGGRSMLN